MSNVRFEVRDHIARVTLDRPAAMNAVDRATELELERVWAAIEADRDVRVVVLTGAGDRAFCAGADLGSFDAQVPELQRHHDRHQFVDLFLLLQDLGKPVVGRINGHALAGGFFQSGGCGLCYPDLQQAAAPQCSNRSQSVSANHWCAEHIQFPAGDRQARPYLQLQNLGLWKIRA